MPPLRTGEQFPNLFLMRPEGTSLEVYELWKKQHALIFFSRHPHPDLTAFISHFQDNARLFEWLNLRLLAVYPAREKIPTPWPAPKSVASLNWASGWPSSAARRIHFRASAKSRLTPFPSA